MIIKSKGTLRYSPTLVGNRQEKWWIILDCDKEIGRYYRNMYELYWYKCRKIQRPSWAEHITVVRNEEPPIKFPWEKYAGKEIEFNYSTDLRSNDEYFWFEVDAPFLLDIRVELGLPRQPEFPLHLTIGNRIRDLQTEFSAV